MSLLTPTYLFVYPYDTHVYLNHTCDKTHEYELIRDKTHEYELIRDKTHEYKLIRDKTHKYEHIRDQSRSWQDSWITYVSFLFAFPLF